MELVEKTVTTFKLRQEYGLTGEPLRQLRVMLQATGHIGCRLSKGGQTYELLKPLPNGVHVVQAAYRGLYRTDVQNAMEDVTSEIESLADEMAEWRDNMGQYDGLAQTEKYNEVEECANTLESIRDGFYDVPDAVAELELWDTPVYDVRLLQGRSRYLGRGRRAANAANTLRNITDAILGEYPLCAPDEETQEFVDNLNEQVDELEALDFPTM